MKLVTRVISRSREFYILKNEHGFWGIEMIFLVDGISFLVSSFSEGFISYQDSQFEQGMLLLTNNGIFYDFIAADEFFDD